MYRTYLHRITSDQALTTVEEAVKFVREIGLVLRTPNPYLPSLFGAAQGKPFKPGAGAATSCVDPQETRLCCNRGDDISN